jgi:hypothetical protein
MKWRRFMVLDKTSPLAAVSLPLILLLRRPQTRYNWRKHVPQVSFYDPPEIGIIADLVVDCLHVERFSKLTTNYFART